MARRNRERKAHRLAGPVVGILSQDDGAHVFGAGVGQGVEDVLLGGVDRLLAAQALNFCKQLPGLLDHPGWGAVEPRFNVRRVFHGWSLLDLVI